MKTDDMINTMHCPQINLSYTELETSTKLYIYRNTLIDKTTVDIENKTFM